MSGQFFTIVFKGDIRKLDFNPLKAQTIFGEPVASGVGNAYEQDTDVAQWMIANGYATGRSDTVPDMLGELESQAKERGRDSCMDSSNGD